MRVIRFLFLWLLFCSSSCICEVLPDIKVTQHVLDNGLIVYMMPDHRSSFVMQLMFYKSGSFNDPFAKSGLAHLLEHLTFHGNDSHKQEAFMDILAGCAQYNAVTRFDSTVYWELCDANMLNNIISLGAERMRSFDNITSNVLQNEIEIVVNELNMRLFDNPEASLMYLIRSMIFNNLDMRGRFIGGSENEVRMITSDDVKLFHQMNYDPSNAILLLSGDIDESKVMDWVVDRYGSIESRRDECIDFCNEKKISSEDHYHAKCVLNNADCSKVSRNSIFTALRRLSPELMIKTDQVLFPKLLLFMPYSVENIQRTSLKVALHIFAGSEFGILQQKLITDSKIATQIDLLSEINLYSTDAMHEPEMISIEAAEGITFQDLKTAVYDVIDEYVSAGIDDEQLKNAKTSLLYARLYTLDNIVNRTSMLKDELVYCGLECAKYEELITSVTQKDVNKAIKDFFTGYYIAGGILPSVVEE